jgi:hypothetical protein
MGTNLVKLVDTPHPKSGIEHHWTSFSSNWACSIPLESSFNSTSNGIKHALFGRKLTPLDLPKVYTLVFDSFQLHTWERMGTHGNAGTWMMIGVKWVGGFQLLWIILWAFTLWTAKLLLSIL